jgi:hypothetical protein
MIVRQAQNANVPVFSLVCCCCFALLWVGSATAGWNQRSRASMNAVPEDDTPWVPFLVELIGKEMYAALNRPKYKVGSNPRRNIRATVKALSYA